MSRVETKVWAAVVGAGGGTVVGNAVLWALGVWLWHAPSNAANAKAALEAVPPYIASLVALAFTTVGTFAGGYAAPSSNHAGAAAARVMDDSEAGHDEPAAAADVATPDDSDADDDGPESGALGGSAIDDDDAETGTLDGDGGGDGDTGGGGSDGDGDPGGDAADAGPTNGVAAEGALPDDIRPARLPSHLAEV